MHRLRVPLALVALAALAGLATLPGAATARPKKDEPQYVITFHAGFSLDQSEAIELSPPPGCKGQASENLQLALSTQAVGVTPPGPFGQEGRYYYYLFRAPLKGLTGTDSAATTGHWEVDPAAEPDPFHPFDPSTCVFRPGQAESKCTFDAEATGTKGPQFALQSQPGKGGRLYFVHVDEWIKDCGYGSKSVGLVAGGFSTEPIATKLSVADLPALHQGHSISDSGHRTLSRPPGGTAGMIPGTEDGTETVSYRLKIKRVR